MATRTISTKLAIEGESEYRASLTRINSEIKTLQSALKLTESQYQTNANSMAALTAKGEALNNLYKAQETKVKELRSALENAKAAESTYAAQKQQLKEKIEANNKALEELKNTTRDTTEEQERLTAKNKELGQQLEKCEANLDAAGKGVDNWQNQLNNAEIKLNDLDAELKLNEKYLEEAKESADGCATSIDEFGNKIKESADAADTLKEALMAAGVVAALKATADALKACVEESIEFESAMAGVAKTTDMSEVELNDMGEAIKDLATKIPATAAEIANVTEAAGQLGISKEDLLSFSEVMVNLGVATNLSSTEAASALAKFANVVSMSADDYERLGSTIVDLGNNFATTEADIVSMATRLASSGAIIGLSEAEIMAVATALSSVGIEAEAGGSAISKLLKQFETMVQMGSPALADFAAVAGMSADEFAKAWGENAVEALSLFIDGLKGMDDAGGSSVAILEDLGLTEIRLSNAVLALASSSGILNSALDTANEAWEENNALSKEAETRYATTESRLQLLSNAFDNVKIAVGDQLTPALGNMADTGADVLNWAADMIEKHEWLAPAVTAVATAIGVLAAGIVTYTAVTKLASIATTAFTAVLDANPIFLAATAIAGLVAGIGVLIACLRDEAIPEVEALNGAVENMETAFEEASAEFEQTQTSIEGASSIATDYINRLVELEKQTSMTADEQDEYKTILDKLKYILPDVNFEIDEQTGLLIGGAEALYSQVDAWKALAVQQALQKQYTTEVENYAAAEAAAYTAKAKLNAAIVEGQVMQDEYNRLVEEYCALGEQIMAVYDDTTLSAQEQTLAIWELEEQQFALDDQIRALSSDMRDNEKAQDDLTESFEDAEGALEKYKVPLDEAKAALDLYNEELQNNSVLLGENAEASAANSEAITSITERINNLAESYKEAYDAAYESISGQIGLFDTFAAEISEDTDTVEEMMSVWAEQTQNLAAYTENLKLAAQYGLDEGLILSLSDGSTASAGYIATIIEKIEELGGYTEGMSTEASDFVDEFNAAFARTEEAKTSFAETVAAIETDFDDAVAALEQAAAEVNFSGFTDALENAFSNIGIDFNSIGKDAGSGLASGIDDTSGQVESAAEDMAQGAVDATRSTLDSHSDSRVMISVGQDFVGGMITGIKSRESELKSLVESLSDEISEGMSRSATDAVRDYIDEFSKLPNEIRTKLNDLKNTITNTTSSLPGEMTSVGRQMVNGMISGLNSRSSSLYSTVRSIVNNAIAAARSAAATASPSKKTTKIFEDVGEGMVVGLENKRARIAETAQGVVDEALELNVSGKIEAALSGIDDRMPHIDSRNGSGGDYRSYKIENNFHIEKVEVRDDTDIHRIAEELYDLEQREMRKRGVKM